MALRYHLDESVSIAVAEGLRGRGIDVTTPREAGLLSASDEAQLEFATHKSRVLMSHDADFLRLHHSGITHAGIAYSRQGHRSIGEIVMSLSWLARTKNEHDLAGQVHFL